MSDKIVQLRKKKNRQNAQCLSKKNVFVFMNCNYLKRKKDIVELVQSPDVGHVFDHA